MSKALRRVLTALSVLLLGAAASIVAADPAHAGLRPRYCAAKTAGAYKLDFCVRGWVEDGAGAFAKTRGVVEMHTYRYVAGAPNGGWVDSTSQSITLNFAAMVRDGYPSTQFTWGNTGAQYDCRINGPAGSIGCSVPNTARVAFYSKANDYDYGRWQLWLYDVSFRDAQGVAHIWTSNTPILSQSWEY